MPKPKKIEINVPGLFVEAILEGLRRIKGGKNETRKVG